MSAANLSAVKMFGTSLKCAIEDIDIEDKGGKLVHYIDNDVLMRAIGKAHGILSSRALSSRTGRGELVEELLVCSLVASGFCGTFYMLWPHLAELHKHTVDTELKDPPAGELQKMIRLQKAEELIKQVDECFEIYVHTDDRVKFMKDNILPSVEPAQMIALDFFSAPGWSERKRGVAGSLHLRDEHGQKLDELLRSKLVWMMSKAVELSREHTAPVHGRQISDIDQLDGAALVSLAHQCSRGGDVHYRFYTQTPTLKKLITRQFKERKDRDRLALELLDQYIPLEGERSLHEVLNTVQGVCRDSLYYILRACHPALSFLKEERETVPDHHVSIDSLREIQAGCEVMIAQETDAEEDSEKDGGLSHSGSAESMYGEILGSGDPLVTIKRQLRRSVITNLQSNIWLGKNKLADRFAESVQRWREIRILAEQNAEQLWIPEGHAKEIKKQFKLYNNYKNDLARIESSARNTTLRLPMVADERAAQFKRFPFGRWIHAASEEFQNDGIRELYEERLRKVLSANPSDREQETRRLCDVCFREQPFENARDLVCDLQLYWDIGLHSDVVALYESANFKRLFSSRCIYLASVAMGNAVSNYDLDTLKKLTKSQAGSPSLGHAVSLLSAAIAISDRIVRNLKPEISGESLLASTADTIIEYASSALDRAPDHELAPVVEALRLTVWSYISDTMDTKFYQAVVRRYENKTFADLEYYQQDAIIWSEYQSQYAKRVSEQLRHGMSPGSGIVNDIQDWAEPNRQFFERGETEFLDVFQRVRMHRYKRLLDIAARYSDADQS